MNPIPFNQIPFITQLIIKDNRLKYEMDDIKESNLYIMKTDAYLPFGISKFTNNDYDFYSAKIALNDEDYQIANQLENMIQERIDPITDYTYRPFILSTVYDEKEYHSINAKFIIGNSFAFDTKRKPVEVNDFITRYPKKIKADMLISFGYYKNDKDKTYGYKAYINQIKARNDNQKCLF